MSFQKAKLESNARCAAEIRVRGLVQGVGFRPAIWRLALALGVDGEALNDGQGLVIRVSGACEAVDQFKEHLVARAPTLARIDAIEVNDWAPAEPLRGFRIATSRDSYARTIIAPDVATCDACRADIADAKNRHFGYALTACVDCGPRLSVITGLPFDRSRTTMAGFALCPDCAADYADPADRRCHAETIACPRCGPKVELVALGGEDLPGDSEPIAAAARLLREGRCVAIKGLGGYQLACDATSAEAVGLLRRAKRRPSKPLALMARDLDVVRRYAILSAAEEALLLSRAAPIVLVRLRPDHGLLETIAPGLDSAGFMLAATPLHLLLLAAVDTPLVMTSGNSSEEPQVIDDAEAQAKLGAIAGHALTHNRPIAMRVDDSVVQVVAGRPQVLRLGRGLSPLTLVLPDGFAAAPSVLAYGGDLKAAFCLTFDGTVALSPHQGDLAEARTADEFLAHVDHFARLLDHRPTIFAADLHPDYVSTRVALARQASSNARVERVQHHHAHIVSCLAEHRRPLAAPAVLGIALDGTGFGDDGTYWGGELMIADYRDYRRLGRLKPVPLFGGDAAAREPWRNLYAQIVSGDGWQAVADAYPRLASIRDLAARPLATLDRMRLSGLNVPLSSSCGRLFDAVAAAVGIAPERLGYEGEAAMRLEAAADGQACNTGKLPSDGYRFGIRDGDLVEIDPAPMLAAVFEDNSAGADASLVALRFHDGLCEAIAAAACRIIRHETGLGRRIDTIAVAGGVINNRLIREGLAKTLMPLGCSVLFNEQVPPGDGGLALGQAMVAAARAIDKRRR